jgi:hypothetical protein
MLWYKGWLETRWRFAFSIGIMTCFLLFYYWTGVKSPPPKRIGDVLGGAIVSVLWMGTLLAGAGINTQPGFQASRGLHGSAYFTLSLPVSRFRLLLVRSSLGWLLQTGITIAFCYGFWNVFPAVRSVATAWDMTEYALMLSAYGSAFYFTSVLLGTFLDDQWRIWGSVIAWVGTSLICYFSPLPPSTNLFQAVQGNSPLVVHDMPWAAFFLAVGMTLVLFWAASRVVRVREY